MGILARRCEDRALAAPALVLSCGGARLEFPGDAAHQAAVLRWAVEAAYCARDRVEAAGEAELGVLRRHLPSYAVLYTTSRTQRAEADKYHSVLTCEVCDPPLCVEAAGDGRDLREDGRHPGVQQRGRAGTSQPLPAPGQGMAHT